MLGRLGLSSARGGQRVWSAEQESLCEGDPHALHDLELLIELDSLGDNSLPGVAPATEVTGMPSVPLTMAKPRSSTCWKEKLSNSSAVARADFAK